MVYRHEGLPAFCFCIYRTVEVHLTAVENTTRSQVSETTMDPFSITAAAIGITDVASRSILELRNLIGSLSEAQDVVADVHSSLANIERPLATLKKLTISDETTSIALREDLRKAGVAEAVNSCGVACKKFNGDLTKWTKHSSATKLSLRDRLAVGVWNREKIRTFRTQLQYCEATVHFAVTSAQL